MEQGGLLVTETWRENIYYTSNDSRSDSYVPSFSSFCAHGFIIPIKRIMHTFINAFVHFTFSSRFYTDLIYWVIFED